MEKQCEEQWPQYNQYLQYRSRHNHFRLASRTAERSQSGRCFCMRCAFSRFAKAVSCCDRARSLVSCLTTGVQSTVASEKYRRFTGRRCAPNTAKVIEIAREKALARNRRITGAETGKNGSRKQEEQGS